MQHIQLVHGTTSRSPTLADLNQVLVGAAPAAKINSSEP